MRQQKRAQLDQRKKRKISSFQTLAALMARTFGLSGPRIERPSKPRGTGIKYNRYQPHQGEGEKARRRRQIQRGMLTVSNGLFIAK